MRGSFRGIIKTKLNFILSILLIAALIFPLIGTKAEAGKEGVYLNGAAYYTLEEAVLAQGSDKSTFRFTLELINGSDSTIDLNSYGVAVRDASGNRYSAELAEKITSRVFAGSKKQMKYVAKVPAGLKLEELQAEIFAWNFSIPGYMSTIGKLNVSSILEAKVSDKPEVVINLSDVDSTYSSDSFVSFQLQRSSQVLVDGVWTIFVNAAAENLGYSSLKLPSALQLNLVNGDGLSFSGSIVLGGDKAILPHQKSEVVVSFPVGELGTPDRLVMEFAKKSSTVSSNSSTTASSGAAASATDSITVINSMDITGSLEGLEKGQIQLDFASRKGLTAVLEGVTTDSSSDGIQAEGVYTLKNVGKQAVSVPVLHAFYQIGSSTFSITAEDSAAHPDYLAPGDSTTYYFKGTLPRGVDGSQIQLVVQEAKSDSLNLPVAVASLPAVVESSGAPVSEGGSVYATAIGKLNMEIASTYRLISDEGEDVLMTELLVTNLENDAVKLPSLYVNYSDGTNEIQGEAVYVQSSPYISAGQKAVLYLFAKVPYELTMEKGTLYLGQGVLNQNTWSQKKEWSRLDYEVKDSAITEVQAGDVWYLQDPGRLSSGKIVESKLYDSMEDSESSLLAAIRIEQKNQLTRNGSIIPYSGYIQTSNGEVYTLSSTAETGKLSSNGKALTTLWAEIPSGVLDEKAVVVFGQQITEGVFANPHKTLFQVTPSVPSEADDENITWKINESIYPYNVRFSGIKRTYWEGKYTFEFQYRMKKMDTVTGSNKNRVLHFELEDSLGLVVKSWDVPLEGNGAMDPEVTQTLSLSSGDIEYENDFLNGNRLKIYEKFEDHVRLLGSLNYMLGY